MTMENIYKKMGADRYLPEAGWNDILIRLDRKLSMLDPDYQVLQIKEKFGALRFYYATDVKETAVLEAMDRYVREAEHESAKTCEMCGKPGRQRENAKRLKTLCEEHASAWMNG